MLSGKKSRHTNQQCSD